MKARFVLVLMLVVMVVSVLAVPVLAGDGGGVSTDSWQFCSTCPDY